MGTMRAAGFGPDDLTQLSSAFESAWLAVKSSTTEKNRESARDAIGKAIIGLARAGYRDPGHLANYGAYQGRLYIDLRG